MLYLPEPAKALAIEDLLDALGHPSNPEHAARQLRGLLVAEALATLLAPEFPSDPPSQAYYRLWMACADIRAAGLRSALRAQIDSPDTPPAKQAEAKVLLNRLDHPGGRRTAGDFPLYLAELRDRAARAEGSRHAQAGTLRRLAKLRSDAHRLAYRGLVPQATVDALMPLRRQRDGESRDAYLDFLDVCARGCVAAEISVAAARVVPVAPPPPPPSKERRLYMAAYMRAYRAKKKAAAVDPLS